MCIHTCFGVIVIRDLNIMFEHVHYLYMRFFGNKKKNTQKALHDMALGFQMKHFFPKYNSHNNVFVAII